MENRAVSLDSALCEQHGIAVYRVGDVYDTDDEDIPESDRGKWFVSAIVGAFPEDLVRAIPLADSMQEAERLAVEHLIVRQ